MPIENQPGTYQQLPLNVDETLLIAAALYDKAAHLRSLHAKWEAEGKPLLARQSKASEEKIQTLISRLNMFIAKFPR